MTEKKIDYDYKHRYTKHDHERKKMPIYSYKCLYCETDFDLLIGINQDKPKMECPSCKSNNIEKSFSLFSVGSASNNNATNCSPEQCGECPGMNTSGCMGM